MPLRKQTIQLESSSQVVSNVFLPEFNWIVFLKGKDTLYGNA